MSKKVSTAKLGNRKNFFITLASLCFTNATIINWISYKDIEFFILFSILAIVFLLISMYYKRRLKRIN